MTNLLDETKMLSNLMKHGLSDVKYPACFPCVTQEKILSCEGLVPAPTLGIRTLSGHGGGAWVEVLPFEVLANSLVPGTFPGHRLY